MWARRPVAWLEDIEISVVRAVGWHAGFLGFAAVAGDAAVGKQVEALLVLAVDMEAAAEHFQVLVRCCSAVAVVAVVAVMEMLDVPALVLVVVLVVVLVDVLVDVLVVEVDVADTELCSLAASAVLVQQSW